MNSKYDELAFEDLENVVGGDQREAFRYRAKLYEKYRIPPPTTTIVQKCLLSLPFFSIAINNLYFHTLSRYNK